MFTDPVALKAQRIRVRHQPNRIQNTRRRGNPAIYPNEIKQTESHRITALSELSARV